MISLLLEYSLIYLSFNKGDGVFGNNSRTKFHKINLYFGYNKITAEKINYIENKTGLKLNKFKLPLLLNITNS